MELTQAKLAELLAELLADSLHQPIWGARESIGIKFEMGEKLDEDQGEYHFWISTAHWWLQQGNSKTFDDIVHSESSLTTIEQKISILNGKRMVEVEYHPETFGLVLVFENDVFLRISPYSGKVRDLLQLFTQKEILSIHSDGTYSVEDVF